MNTNMVHVSLSSNNCTRFPLMPMSNVIRALDRFCSWFDYSNKNLQECGVLNLHLSFLM